MAQVLFAASVRSSMIAILLRPCSEQRLTHSLTHTFSPRIVLVLRPRFSSSTANVIRDNSVVVFLGPHLHWLERKNVQLYIERNPTSQINAAINYILILISKPQNVGSLFGPPFLSWVCVEESYKEHRHQNSRTDRRSEPRRNEEEGCNLWRSSDSLAFLS